MNDRLDLALSRAIAAGVLPAGSARPPQELRPWPVVLLTGLGAWLAAVPLLLVVSLLLGDWISRGVGPYLVGALVLGAAVVVLRARSVPLFFEQLAVPALLVGGGSLGFGVFRDLPGRSGAVVLALVALALARAIARPWLRVLLGAAAGGLVAAALLPDGLLFGQGRHIVEAWRALHVVLALWLAGLWLQHAALGGGARAEAAATLESAGGGWLLAALAGLAALSGMSFMVGGVFGGGLVGDVARELLTRQGAHWAPLMTQAVSAALALLAGGMAARAWPGLRQPAILLAVAVLVLLAWFLPMLGATLLALALTATTQRYRLAGAAALAVAWIVGSFYYQLQWPLASKAAVLAGCGALLGGLAWLTHARSARGAAAVLPPPERRRWLFAGAAAATLAVANFGIWEKEQLIARGQPVYVALAPVDPRSLLQGDFVRLNFSVPGALRGEVETLLARGRPQVVARRDARGVATLLRMQRDAEPLAEGEFLIELTPKDGRWILVSDAWFFREGEAKRFEAAKFGEFRVRADGKALLVGVADAQLQPITP